MLGAGIWFDGGTLPDPGARRDRRRLGTAVLHDLRDVPRSGGAGTSSQAADLVLMLAWHGDGCTPLSLSLQVVTGLAFLLAF